MATLTETAYYTRRTINWIILGVILYIILRIFWSTIIALWLSFFPPKPPPPNHRFGKLPALVFPKQTNPAGQLTFRLETIEGSVPKASDSATVYFMKKTNPDLLALNRTQVFAERLGLDPTPTAETKNIFNFHDARFPLLQLRYDIVTNNFSLRYIFEQDTGLFNDRSLPTVDTAKAEATSMLQSYNLYVDDFSFGTNTVSFLKLANGQLIPVGSLSVADAVRVDFFRRGIGDMKLFSSNPDEGPVAVIFSGSKNLKKRILLFSYVYWPIDYDTTATYALKTSAAAWQELQNGGGYIARFPKTGTMALVRNVYLGYYDSLDPQTYLQPIFIFEGDNGFLAYVPAVSPEWVEK